LLVGCERRFGSSFKGMKIPSMIQSIASMVNGRLERLVLTIRGIVAANRVDGDACRSGLG